MGNRAVLTGPSKKFGVYVHWNGGMDTVKGICEFMRSHNFTDPADDESYALARLCQVYSNLFEGSYSVGIGPYDELDTNNGDNGVYVLGKDWTIVERIYECETEQEDYSLGQIVKLITDHMPAGYKYEN